MAGRAQRLKLRLFLEGVELPVIGAQVVGLPNAPLQAAIQIPPLAEGTRLLPRTLVHLFFNDFVEVDSPYVGFNKQVADSQEKDPTAYEKERRNRDNMSGEEQDATASDFEHDIENEQYKLLFVGELLGFQWTKNASNRSLVLQCQDLSNYWDYAYQWSNTDLFGPGIKALFSGGSTNLFTDFLSTPGEELVRSLMQPSLTFPNLKGLAGGLIHMLEQIGGSYATDKKIAGTNIFFTLAELRLRIMQQIVTYEDDPTAQNLLARQGYGGLFNRLLGGQGRQVSIRQAINALQGIIFYETFAQPSPLYEPGTAGTVAGKEEKVLSDDPRTVGVASTVAGVRASVQEVKQEVHVADNMPNKTHLAKGDQQVLKNLKQIVIDRLGQMALTLKRQLQQLRSVNVTGATSLLTVAAQNLTGAKALMSGWQPTDAKVIGKIDKLLDEAADRLDRFQRLTVSQTAKKDVRPARLNQQIFRPDVWFSAPPRCNVIFPDQYDTLQYQRAFMEEPTRLLLKTNDEFFGEDELFDHYYFAPKTRSLKTSKTTLQKMLQNDLLAHEILTGILPVFEKMGELNIFAARGGVIKDKAQNVGLAQRSANFLYFKYRFAARQMQVRGRFNPYIAMGFPGVVIDKYVDADTLKLYNTLLEKAGRATRDINKLLGTNFLGNFTQVTHTVNQQQGSTEVVLSYPRQPEESVEFLGASDKEITETDQRFAEPATQTTDVAALYAPKVMSQGPNGGQILRVIEVTQLYNVRAAEEGSFVGDEADVSTKPLLLFGAATKPGTTPQKVTANVPVGFAVDAQKLPKNVVLGLGITLPNTGKQKPFYPITIKAWRIDEATPRFKQEEVDLPVEEYIRPGWYGDIWHPSNISKAYQRFFRTTAITDSTQVVDNTDGAASTAQGFSNQDNQSDDPSNVPAIFKLNAGASIEQAVAFIAASYSYTRQHGLGLEEFIRGYTWRPIATMVDIFGTSDLVLSQDGSEVVQGIEGLHSKAFGNFDDLFGLVTPAIEEVVGLKRGTLAAQKGDTRKMKRDKVLDYISSLTFRAILG